MTAPSISRQSVARRMIGLSGPFGTAIVSRGGQTLLAVYLARTLGAGGYGTFIFATGAAVICGMIADLGWPNVVNREMPRHLRDGDLGRLRGLIRASDFFILLLGLFFIALLLILAAVVPHLAQGFQGAAMLVMPMGFIFMRQQQMAAVDRATIGMLVDQGMAATIVFIANLLHPMDVMETIATYSAATTALVLGGNSLFQSRLPKEWRNVRPTYAMRSWLGASASMFGSLLPRILLPRFDVLLITPIAGVAQAGLFGAAVRLTLLMTFPQFILQTLVLPRFSRAFAKGDHAGVRRLLVGSLIFAIVTTLPIILPILLVPDQVMHLFFGDQFAVGGPILFWLGIGQFSIAASIPLSAMIGMGGDQRALGRQGIGIMAITFVIGWLVIPRYGALGAAIVAAGANLALAVGMCRLAVPILRWTAAGGAQGGTTPQTTQREPQPD